MKKIFYALILLFIPFNVGAASISSSSLTGKPSVEINNYYSIDIVINVKDTSKDVKGIAAVGYNIEFDENIFIPTSIETAGFSSDIYEENGEYIVLSEAIESSDFKCKDGVLHCGSYIAKITFYVKNVDTTTTSIQMNNMSIGVLNVDYNEVEYTEDDVEFATSTIVKSQNIKIYNNNSSVVTEKPNSSNQTKTNTQNSSTSVKKEETTTSTPKENLPKSKNNNVSSITVEEYDFDFSKEKKEYDLVVSKYANQLKFNIKLEDEKATYKIIGADNLEKNDYKVLIEITAENGDKNTYTINVEKEDTDDVVVADKKKENNFNIDKKYIIIGAVVLGGIIILGIVLYIIFNKENRKIEKGIDNL